MYVWFFKSGGRVGTSYNPTNLADSSSITVQSVFNASGLVAGQNVPLYNANGAVSLSVETTDTEAGDDSMLAAQGAVSFGNGVLVNTYMLTNTESATGALSSGTTSTNSEFGSTDDRATFNYDPTTQSLSSVTTTDYSNGVPTGTTIVDGNGDPITTGGGGHGGDGLTDDS